MNLIKSIFAALALALAAPVAAAHEHGGDHHAGQAQYDAAMAAVAGHYEGTVTFADGGEAVTGWTLRPNGELRTDDDFTGSWFVEGDMVVVTYDTEERATYIGRVNGDAITGRFTQQRGDVYGTFAWTRAPDRPDPRPMGGGAPGAAEGTWEGTVTFDDGGVAVTTWTLFAGGPFERGDGFTGFWTRTGDMVRVSYDTDTGAVYVGRFDVPDRIAGRFYQKRGDVTGSFTWTRQ